MLKCSVCTNHLSHPDLSDYPNPIPSSSSKNNTSRKVLLPHHYIETSFPELPFLMNSFLLDVPYILHQPNTWFPSLVTHLPWGYPVFSSTALRSNQPLVQSTDKSETLWLHTWVPFPFSWQVPFKKPFLSLSQQIICQHANEKIGQMISNFVFTSYGCASIALVLGICNFDNH